MDWLRENWFWLLVGIAIFWMHVKMHGGHHGAQSSGTDEPHHGPGLPRGGSDHAADTLEDETHGKH